MTIDDLRHADARASTTSRTRPAAIAVAHELGIADEAIRKGLSAFGGVKRRFTPTGAWNGVADLRRLRPPPGRDRRRAEGRARCRQRAA